MTKMKKGGVIAALCSVVAVGGGLVTINQIQKSDPVVINTYESEAEEKDYTVMVYMVGSDLESEEDEIMGAGSKDLQEMLDVMTGEQSETINEKMNLVVEIGGSYQWEMEALGDMKHARFCVNEDGIGQITELADTNMGESAGLSDFINYASGTYPAENYVLLFWNHGNGPVDGFGYDVLHSGDSMMLSELSEGIGQSELADTRFELVGFDACLMGSIETAGVMSEYADYMVASAELEPEDGWDYQWMQVFAEEELGGEIIGARIVDSYFTYYEDKNFPVTLSCMELGAYPKVKEHLDTYFKLIQTMEKQEIYESLSQTRKQVQGFGNSISATDSPDLVDLQQLFTTLSEDAWQKAELDSALERLMCARQAKGYAQPVCGISIYLPSGSDMLLEENLQKYRECGFSGAYLELAYGYGDYLLNGEIVDFEQEMQHCGVDETHLYAELPQELLSQISAVYLVTAVPLPDLPECSYVLSTDSDLTIDADGRIDAVPDGQYTALKGQVLCLIEQYNCEDQTDFLSPVLYNGELCMMKIRFSYENLDGEIVSIVPVDAEKPSAKKEYELAVGDTVVPLYPLFTDDSTPMDQLEGRTDIYENLYYIGHEVTMEDEADLWFESVTVDLRECVFGFMIEDNRQQFQYTQLQHLELPGDGEKISSPAAAP